MVLRTRPEDDDWQSVKDAKKRKQIQDRLAQRARRRRLREARGDITSLQQSSRSTSQTSDSNGSPANLGQDATFSAGTDLRYSKTPEQATDSVSISWQIIEFNDLDDLPKLESTPTDAQLGNPDLLPNNLHTAIPSPLSSQLTLPLNVFTALFLNGQILSIPCSTIIASKSPPPSPLIPVPLRPTASQLTTVHFQWIDRLPFPKLRDSLIKLQGVVDLDEFLNDIFVAPSFRIKKGAESWDPRAWSMEEGWARKWGWLFF